nr:LamG domain-containing protein [Actinophytocola xanthii]
MVLSGGTVTAANAVATNASFTVAAWVRLNQADASRTAVSQSGSQTSGFQLGYRPADGGRWFFSMPQADSASATVDLASSALAATPGTPTHLAGVYDSRKKEIRLYVNGEHSRTVPHITSWAATGQVRVGGEMSSGVATNAWFGMLDEVQLYDRPLPEEELRASVSRNNVQVAHWKFDEAIELPEPGTTARNAVEGGDMAVLADDAAFVEGGVAESGAVEFGAGGGPGSATTHGPVVRTDQSFSVAAWVKLSDTQAVNRAAICQDGARNSGFCLGHESTRTWSFGMPTSDANAAPVVAARSDNAVSTEWTHLVGVHNAASKQLQLYVDGELESTVAYTTPWHAAGRFRTGQALVAGQLERPWDGLLDEVRVYSRVISPDEVQGIVAQDDVTAGTWKLDGDGTDSTAARNGKVEGDPAWTAGQSANPSPGDLALLLAGASDEYVHAPKSVDTDRSFSVTAWVRVDQPGRQATVVSQDGRQASGFVLRSTAANQWSFGMPRTDANNPVLDQAVGGAVQVGVWAHLTGVYSTFPVGSAMQGRLELYVNGVLVGAATHTPSTPASGELHIGRSRHNGAYAEYFAGAIDDVSVYTRPLLGDEIRTKAGRDLSLVHHWRLDEISGASAADSVGARGGTLSAGASFGQGRVGNGVGLTGTGVVSTTGVDLRTDQSFTVAAYLYLGDASVPATAVSLDGTHASKFQLRHRPPRDTHAFGQWTFEMASGDTAGTPEVLAAVSTTPSEVGQWVHLVGVYDQPSGLIRLYVNGERQNDNHLPSAWNSSGGLVVGRGLSDDQPVEYWPGRVDDVRLYTGALDRTRVGTLYQSFPAEQAPPTLPETDLGEWTFNEGSGNVANDASEYQRHALIHGGTGTSSDWPAGRRDRAAWFDGDGYAQTTEPVVRDGQSFSATAWVYLTTQGGADKVVLAQDGNHASSFQLKYDTTAKRWAVVMPESDTANPATKVLTSTESGWLGEWTHLGVVYDSSGTGQLRLYVNGMLVGHRSGVKATVASGPFTIGRGRWNGATMGFFAGGVDDVRVFSGALTDGEIRLVHDSASWVTVGSWRFDDGNRDYTGRTDLFLSSQGVTFTPGISGVALQFDGVTGGAATSLQGLSMRDSFTVSAWARLSRGDQVATVLAQDGSRMSGFVLQYRPENGRWVFGSRASDTDGAALTFTSSAQPAVLNQWVHLAGVYDRAAQQLRLYVDGRLAGTRNYQPLWAAAGGLTVGRGKVNGARAEFFPGTVDEARADLGMLPDAQIARLASWSPPISGSLGAFVNEAGDRYSAPTSEPIRAGYRFERTLGMPATDMQDGTHVLYSCRSGTDLFTSTDSACGGDVLLGEVGRVYTTPPAGMPTVPLRRCARAGDRFDALTCGTGTEEQVVLGHTVAYARLARYQGPYGDDHWTTFDGTTPGYLLEGPQGWVPLVSLPGTQPLFSCRDDTDRFTSIDPGCEGKQLLSASGYVYTTPPPELLTLPLYRCLSAVGYDGAVQRFNSLSENCEGQTADRLLGHVLAAAPTPDSP